MTKTVEELQAELEAAKASITNLEGTNASLKTENKDYKSKISKALTEKEEAEANAEREAGNIAAIEARLTKTFQAQIDALTAERDAHAADLRTMRVDNEVKSAMAANKVRPELQPAVEALLLRQATYDDGVATINGKPIADAAKAFFSSKDGSYFVSAPESTGSGSTGTSGVSAVKFSKAPETPQEYNDFMKYSATNKAEANAYAMKWERSDLMS